HAACGTTRAIQVNCTDHRAGSRVAQPKYFQSRRRSHRSEKPSGEKTMARNTAFTGMTMGRGEAVFRFLTRVIENVPTPLSPVAKTLPSLEIAIPNGLGGPTLLSSPSGVIRRPLGRTDASKPLILTC